jgi:acyl carrier protein
MSTVVALKRILADLLGDPALAGTLSDTASLLTDVRLDSLELLQFMFEIEAGTGVEIDFTQLDYEHLDSLADLAAFLDGMVRSAPSSSGSQP